MDDGNSNKGGLVLNTQGFTSENVDLLVCALNRNFNISSYKLLDSKRIPYIYVKKVDVLILAAKVKPYMHPSTYYKLSI